MKKETIYFEVGNGQGLRRKGELQVFAIETINYIYAQFDLPAAWRDFDELQAIWSTDEKQAVSGIDEGRAIVIPQELLQDPGTLRVNLSGVNYKKGKLWQRVTTYMEEALKLEHTNI